MHHHIWRVLGRASAHTADTFQCSIVIWQPRLRANSTAVSVGREKNPTMANTKLLMQQLKQQAALTGAFLWISIYSSYSNIFKIHPSLMDASTLTSSSLFRQSPGLQHPLLSQVVRACVQHHNPTLKVTYIHENTYFFNTLFDKIPSLVTFVQYK